MSTDIKTFIFDWDCLDPLYFYRPWTITSINGFNHKSWVRRLSKIYVKKMSKTWSNENSLENLHISNVPEISLIICSSILFLSEFFINLIFKKILICKLIIKPCFLDVNNENKIFTYIIFLIVFFNKDELQQIKKYLKEVFYL